MNRKERQEARADRYRELAEKANKQSNEASQLSRSMVEHIPLGQPILVGHHSERAHRSLLDRSWNTLGKSVKLSEKAEYFEQKAAAAENNDAIYLGDDDAVERLEAKLADLEKKQEMMKETNKIIRSKKLSEIEKHDKLIELGILRMVLGRSLLLITLEILAFQAILLPTMELISAELKNNWRKPSG